MFSKAFIATLLAGTAAATPIAERSTGSFGLVSLKSTTSLQFNEIVANGGQLWIGKKTASFCPDNVGQCPAGTETSFTAGANENVGMNVEVPGGQQLYIAPDGAVSYTIAHSADTHGGKAQGWVYTAAPEGRVGSLTFPGYGFLACASPEGPGIYSIAATPGGTGTGNCTSISLGAATYAGEVTAWQYS